MSAIALIISPIMGSASEGAGPLVVHVSGFKSSKGHAILNLFSEGQDVLNLKQAYRRLRSPIENGKATFLFPAIPYGSYAISVFHDVNDNGELDHRMGFPAEPLAFSNGFHLTMFSGLPSFDKLKFKFTSEMNNLEIRF
jgi:uncharacterized protein (DUF2141 family)